MIQILENYMKERFGDTRRFYREEMQNYIKIARIDHWFKNILIFPGTIVALLLTNRSIWDCWQNVALGFISTCLLASANYVLNEWLDVGFDRFHPVKKNRPAVAAELHPKLVYAEYAGFAIIGIVCASLISKLFLYAALSLLIMGILYNVKPFRTKELCYLDVLSESVNNPIRLFLGWATVTSDLLPPSSLVCAYWMGGAFLMNVKRYAELRSISNKEIAGLYRRSFRYYTENHLLELSLFYAMSVAFFLGVFLIKHRIELLISFPFIAILFAWYLQIAMRPDSPAQRPEKLYKEKTFILYIGFLVVLMSVLLFVEIPLLHWFLGNVFLELHN